jgi:hypothetical protein
LKRTQLVERTPDHLVLVVFVESLGCSAIGFPNSRQACLSFFEGLGSKQSAERFFLVSIRQN